MVGIAVCGAGNWGKNLVRNFAGQPDVELKYICDLSPKIRQRMAGQYPKVRVTDNLAEVLADATVGGVVVAVDVPYHFAVAKAVLEAGKHAFVEKPLTLRALEAEELVNLAAARGCKLMVGHLLRYHPAVQFLKQMVVEGQVDLLYAYFQRLNLGIVRQNENAWWSLAPHDISIACYLFGAAPVTVSATGQSSLQPGIEDVVFAHLKFADGRTAHIHVSWLDPHKARKVTLVGSRKMIAFDDMEASEKIRIYDKGADVKPGVVGYAEAITLRSGEIRIPNISTEEPLALECRHFIECITKDVAPQSDGLDGLQVVRVLEAGSASLAQGGAPVKVGT